MSGHHQETFENSLSLTITLKKFGVIIFLHFQSQMLAMPPVREIFIHIRQLSRKVDNFIGYCWWLVRVALVVVFGFLPRNFGFGFLPRNFGLLVGTYECHLPLCECRWFYLHIVVLLAGGGDTSKLCVVIELLY